MIATYVVVSWLHMWVVCAKAFTHSHRHTYVAYAHDVDLRHVLPAAGRRSAAQNQAKEMCGPEPLAEVMAIWEVIRAYEEEGATPPKWTYWRRSNALRLCKPWLNERQQRILHSIEVLPATWHKYVPAKHWKRASRKLRVPAGLKPLRKRICRMQLEEAGAMMPKERHLAAWAYGPGEGSWRWHFICQEG